VLLIAVKVHALLCAPIDALSVIRVIP